MKRLENQTKQNFELPHVYIAEVVGIKDPEKRNRVQVRILGFIDEETQDYECIWAEQMTNIFSGTSDTSGTSSVPNLGTYVYIQFLYGDPSFPVYTGYVRGNKDSSLLNRVENLEKTIFKTRNDNIIGPELPPLNDKSVYPYNNVIETEKGNIIELDDTTGNERIAIEHKTGSYNEIRPDGTIQFKSVKDFYEIIKENVESYIEKNFNNLTKGLFTVQADGNILFKGDLKVVGGVEVTKDITATGNISSKSEVADSKGNLSSLRDAYNAHYSIGNLGIPTSTPINTDPLIRWGDFTWSGSPL